MRTSILLSCIAALAAYVSTAEDCCETKTVSGAPAGMTELDGVYTLLKKEGNPREEVCIDGCVYLKDDEEYCFRETSKEGGAEVVCQVCSFDSHDKTLFLDPRQPHLRSTPARPQLLHPLHRPSLPPALPPRLQPAPLQPL
jgi:hypothetical protein